MESNSKYYNTRWLILMTLVMLTFMACLDSSIVNVALPAMEDKLKVNMTSIEWVVTSYLIVISGTILIFGRLGDMLGKGRIFKFGIILFSLGSLLCGLSHSIVILVAARVIQAIGAAASMSTSQGIITQVFPSNERGRALGISGSFVALGTMVGPPLGGFITTYIGWEYIFFINVPIGILTAIAAFKFLPVSGKSKEERMDYKGAFLITATIVLLFGAIIEGQTIGYTKSLILICFLVSAVFLFLFVKLENKLSTPLLDMGLFNNGLFTLSVCCAFISFVTISCTNIIQPFYFESALKYSAQKAGLFMMAYPITLAVVAPTSGYLSDKIGSEILTFIGLIITSISMYLMSCLTTTTSVPVMLFYIMLTALGNGLFQSPNTSLIMSTVPRNKLGIAGGINAFMRNLGMVFGVSFSTTLLYNRMSSRIGYHVVNYIKGRDDVFIYGMHIVYLAASLICLIGVVMTALRLYNRRKETGKQEEARGIKA